MNLTIIIPVFNEADIIVRTLDRLRETSLPEFVGHSEVLVVDDCSTDSSAILAEKYEGGYMNLKIIRLPVNSGKGAAVAAGIEAAAGDTIAVLDADLELDPADLPGLLIKYHSGQLDLVSGTRFRTSQNHPGHALAAKTANRIFSFMASSLTGKRITDINCGYKVFSKSLFEKLGISEKRFAIETELMIKASRDSSVRFAEYDVSYHPRRKTEGKKIRISDGLGILGKLFRYGLSGRPWLSTVTIAFIITFMTINMLNVGHWKEEQRIIEWDAISYYAYLPAALIYHDLSLGFIDGYHGPHKFIFWPEKGPEGKYVIKTSMGLSILWLPFFGAGHLAALISGADTGGFSPPYKFFLMVSSLAFLLTGLIFLRRILLFHYSDVIASLVIAGFTFGTNLYWYTLFQGTMAHVYSFALMSAFVWYSVQWHGAKHMVHGTWSSMRLGLLLGLISLIRPTNLVIVLVFLFYGIVSWGGLKARFKSLAADYKYLLIMAAMTIIVWMPQLIYWKTMTGHWLYFSYGSGERFFFGDPAIIKGLFSWRKGLFIYTPLLVFSFAGIIALWTKKSAFAAPVTLFVPVNIYIIFSWWCWWYGGGFGQRAFIDSYALMAVAAAALLAWALSSAKKGLKKTIITIFLSLMSIGIFNNLQYYYGAIHWDSMTRAAYFDSFGRIRPSAKFYRLLEAPDYDAARAGKDRR